MYKKLFAITLSLILILGLGSFAALADETESVPLADFTVGFDSEAELEGWSASGKGESIVIDSTVTDAPEGLDFGTGTLKFEALSAHANGLGINKAVTNLEPGATYIFSAWAKNETGGTAVIGVGHSTSSVATYAASASCSTANTWAKLVCSFTVPADGSVTQRTLCLKQGAGTSAVWYDDVRFYKDTGANPIVTKNLGFENVVNTAVSKSTEDSSKETVLHPLGWTIGDGIKYSASATNYAVISDETAHSGNYSLKLKTSANTATYRAYKRIDNLEPGASYVVTAYVKTIGNATGDGTFMYVTGSPTGGGASHWTQSTTEQGYVFERVKTQTAASATTGKWVPIRTFFTVPEALTSGYIVLTGYDTSKSFTAYYDDITITKMDVPSTFILDATGNTLNKIADRTQETDATIVLSAANNSQEATKAYTFLYALYDESGDVKQISTLVFSDKVAPLASTKNGYAQPGYLRESAHVTIPAGHSLKVFVFDAIATLSPLSFASVA